MHTFAKQIGEHGRRGGRDAIEVVAERREEIAAVLGGQRVVRPRRLAGPGRVRLGRQKHLIGVALHEPLLGGRLLGRFREIANRRLAHVRQIVEGVFAGIGRLFGRL